MAKSKDQKKAIVERLTDAFANSASSVFVHFKGMNVSEETEMRNALRAQGVSYYVARKTLIKRATDASNVSGTAPELEGEIAIAYGGADASAPAGGVYAFVKKFKDKLAIVGGIFEGAFKNKAEMNDIATIPPMPVLRGMFVNVINSPIQGMAIVLKAIADKKSQ
jgi:large subunit ribosomal protein L10